MIGITAFGFAIGAPVIGVILLILLFPLGGFFRDWRRFRMQGLTVRQALKALVTQRFRDKPLPFHLGHPNAEFRARQDRDMPEK